MKIEVKWNPAWTRPERALGDRRLWLLGSIAVRHLESVNPVLRIEVFHKRIAAVLGLCALLAYLAAATALWFWLSRTPQNQVGWGLAATAPFRWETFRERRGDTDIALAQERLRRREWGEAFFALRTGVARSPGNVPGRLALAALLNSGSPGQALRTVEEGITRSAADPDLLRALFALYQQHNARSRALATAAELLARQPSLPATARQVAANALAALLLEQGDVAGAAKLLDGLEFAGNEFENRRSRILRSDLRRLEGRPGEALAELAEATPRGHPDVLRAEAEVAVSARDEDALERVLRRWRAADGEKPNAYLFAFHAWHRLGRLSLRDGAEQDFFTAFGHREAALQLFAASAVAQGLPDAVRRAEEVASAGGFSRFAFRVHLSELALRAGEFDAAHRLLRDWEGQIETLPPMQRAYPEFIDRLTRLAVGGPTQPVAALATHVAEMRGQATPGIVLLGADVLERGGHLEGALELVETGLRAYPEADPLRERSVRLAAAVAAVAPAAPEATRGAPEAPLMTAAEAVASLDAAFEAGRLVEARELLRRFRAFPAERDPSWAELDVRELQLVLLTRDALASRAAVRAHLGRLSGAAPALRMLALADTLDAAGHAEAARLVRSEVASAAGSLPAVAAAMAGAAGEEMPADAPAALAAVDAALRRDDPDHALWLIEEFRRRRPAWVEDVQVALTVREVRARLGQDRRPAALVALRGLVLRPGAPRAAAFGLVRELSAAGDDGSARALAREIVRLLPGDKAAADLLRGLDAPPPAGG